MTASIRADLSQPVKDTISYALRAYVFLAPFRGGKYHLNNLNQLADLISGYYDTANPRTAHIVNVLRANNEHVTMTA